jgi:hypothetical protein
MLLLCIIGTRIYRNMLLVKRVAQMKVWHSYKILDRKRKGKTVFCRTRRISEDNTKAERKSRLERRWLD